MEITLKEYEKMLQEFDWYYEFSDDYQVVKKGRKKEIKIKALSNKNKEFKDLYNKYYNKHFKNTI